MFEKTITKSAYKVLCLIYEEYLQRCDTMSRDSAAEFDETPDFILAYFSQDDSYSCLTELKNNGLIKMYINGSFCLTNSAIIYMENRFKNGLSELISFISSLKP